MKLYCDVPAKRSRTIVADVALVVMVLLFAWLALSVHDAVNRLAVLGSGVRESGTSVQNGFGSVASSVDGIPLVGGQLADAFNGAGNQSGGRVAALGKKGEDSVHRLAWILGFVVFLLPTLIVLALLLPRRIRQVRELTAAAGVLVDPDDPRRRQLLAMRAAFDLPYGTLATYTRDPFGDLIHERYDALVQAALDDAGVLPRAVPALSPPVG